MTQHRGVAAWERPLVFGLLMLGFGIRLAVALHWPVEPRNDAAAYHALAVALSQGEGYGLGGVPETVWPPGFPAVLGGSYRAFGVSLGVAGCLQSLVDVGAVAVLWVWMRWRLGGIVALWGLALAVMSETAVAACRMVRSEVLASALLVTALVLVDVARTARHRRTLLAGAGLLLGALSLVRWNFTLLGPALVPLVWTWPQARRERLISSLVLCTAMALVLVPWLVRNQAVLGAPVLSTQTGRTLYMSHIRKPGQPYGVNTDDETTRRAQALPSLDGNRYLVGQTFDRLHREPWLLIGKIPEKLFYFLVPFDWEILSADGTRRFNVGYLVVGALALCGLPSLWRRDRHLTALLVWPMLYLGLLCVPFYGSPRFRMPAEPLLVPLGALTLARTRIPWRRT